MSPFACGRKPRSRNVGFSACWGSLVALQRGVVSLLQIY